MSDPRDAASGYRVTEDGQDRITEDGANYRILEAAITFASARGSASLE